MKTLFCIERGGAQNGSVNGASGESTTNRRASVLLVNRLWCLSGRAVLSIYGPSPSRSSYKALIFTRDAGQMVDRVASFCAAPPGGTVQLYVSAYDCDLLWRKYGYSKRRRTNDFWRQNWRSTTFHVETFQKLSRVRGYYFFFYVSVSPRAMCDWRILFKCDRTAHLRTFGFKFLSPDNCLRHVIGINICGSITGGLSKRPDTWLSITDYNFIRDQHFTALVCWNKARSNALTCFDTRFRCINTRLFT